MKHIFTNNYNSQADLDLLELIKGGSKAALDALIKKHYNYIYNIALRFVLNPEDAQDLTQEVIVKVITKLDQFQRKSEFRSWLYRIVFNHFITMKKRNLESMIISFDDYGKSLDEIPNIDLSEPEYNEYKLMIEDAKIGCMTGMILCLSREQRIVFILGEIFNVESKLGSTLLDISADNFRKILSRARKDLYGFMNNKCGLINSNNPCRCSKKTKGFIEAGWVNKENLQFNADFLEKIELTSIEKSNKCDNLLENEYAELYQDHPFYNRDKSQEMISSLVQNDTLKDIFNLN